MPNPSQADLDFLALATSRFKTAAEATAAFREAALEDLRFRNGEQWPDDIKRARLAEKRPCLTVNKLSGPIKQITNQQKNAKLAIDVIPAGGGARQETAEVFQGLVRAIEVASNAPHIYSWGFEQAVTTGLGYWRVLTDYADDQSFDLDLKIARILNPFTVYLDPAAQELDASDMQWAFIVEDMDKEDFKARYVGKRAKDDDAEALSADEFASLGDEPQDWYPNGRIRVAEYWYTETVQKQIAQLADGSVVDVGAAPEGIPVLATRDVDARVVKWAKIGADRVLERADWPGKYIPIVPVFGEEIVLDGERIFRGLVREGRDPQRIYNYWVTSQTESIALGKTAPWVAAEGQLEGYEADWKTAHLRNIPVLQYKPTSLLGHPLPPPQRQVAEPPIQAITMAIMQADNDIKATTGLFDPSLGNINSRERSGRAIQALQKQGELANSNFLDNLSRAIAYTGRILVDLIPAVYDRPGRVARLLQPDNQARMVALNAPFVPGPQGMPQVVPPGMPGPQGTPPQEYDLRTGRYAVTVQVGPAYNTQRQEAVASMLELINAFPAMAPMVGDLVVSEMDWPGAKAVAERLKKMLPPPLQDDQQGQQIPPQVQQQLAQQGQMVEQLTAALNEVQRKLETNEAKAQADLQAAQMKTAADLQMKQAEIASRERIAAMQVQADLVQIEAQMNAERAQWLLKEQLANTREMFKADVASMTARDRMDREVALEGERLDREDAREREGLSREDARAWAELAQSGAVEDRKLSLAEQQGQEVARLAQQDARTRAQSARRGED